MATRNYELKRGVVLQAFGDASKTCTNDTLTDELAVWYLTHYPEKAIYFSRVPVILPPPPEIKIVEPIKKVEVPINLIKETLSDIEGKPVEIKIIKPQVTKTSTKNKSKAKK